MNKTTPLPDRICVILLNWNGKKDTLECLASLQKVEYPRFTTIVVDNGSSDDSVTAIRAAHPQVPIFETKQNLGFAGGNNVGIEWALSKPFEWIFLLNNDTTIAPDCLTAFMEAAKQNPQAKIFGAKILRYSDPHRIDHLGGIWNPEKVEFESKRGGDLDEERIESEPVDYVCGAALLMHRSVPEAIGLLEPSFFLFWEETDFCFRARRKGFGVWTAPKAKIWHKVSSSFTGGKPHSHYFWWRSRLLWLERNIPEEERRLLYKNVLFPELRKSLRHFVLKTLQQKWEQLSFRSPNLERQIKIKRLKAGLHGALDFYRKRFGNCPEWISKR
jgi:GT2 family glycosyltransferase